MKIKIYIKSIKCICSNQSPGDVFFLKFLDLIFKNCGSIISHNRKTIADKCNIYKLFNTIKLNDRYKLSKL